MRLPPDIVERLDQHADVLGDQMGGISMARAQAARMLIINALNGMEPNERKKRRTT